MIESIAAASMEMEATELYTAYSTLLAKKAMEAQQTSAEALLAQTQTLPVSIPQAPAITEAHYIDTYA